MPNQQFTLIVEGADLRSRTVFDALFEAGCDDATIGSVDDTHYIDFDREAAGLGEAILSAVRDVKKVEGLRVTRVVDVGPNLPAAIGPRTGCAGENAGLFFTAPPHTAWPPFTGDGLPQPQRHSALFRLRTPLPSQDRARMAASGHVLHAVNAYLDRTVPVSRAPSDPAALPSTVGRPPLTMVALPSS